MDTQKFFENWMNAQNSAFSQCLDSTKKFQEATLGGKSLENGSDIYKEFINGQMKILSDLEKKADIHTDEESQKKGTADFFDTCWAFNKKALDTLLEQQEKALDLLKDNNHDSFESNELVESFQKSQKEFINLFNDQLKSFMDNFKNLTPGEQEKSSASLEELKQELKTLNERIEKIEKKKTATAAKEK